MIRGCGGIDINDEGLLLMLRSGTSTYNDLWSNTGGTVEVGEIPIRAVVREHREELGVRIKVLRYISDYHAVKKGRVWGVFSGYLVETTEGTPTIQEPDKVAELRRFPLDNLPEKLAPYTRKYLRDLKLI